MATTWGNGRQHEACVRQTLTHVHAFSSVAVVPYSASWMCDLQLSGLKVLFDTAQISFSELYTDNCPTCDGAGMMTCGYCKGSKTLRARPSRLVRNAKGQAMLLHFDRDVDECWHCGPPSKLDFNMDSDDVNDEMESLRIMENFSAALAGRPMPFEWAPLAGTVPCQTCMGSKKLHRHTPNIEKVFGLGDDIWTKVRAWTVACAVVCRSGVLLPCSCCGAHLQVHILTDGICQEWLQFECYVDMHRSGMMAQFG